MDFNHISRWLVFIGVGFIAAGLIFWLVNVFIGPKNIPGTLRIDIGGITCVFPILASIILSLVLTLVLNIIARLLNK
jgi:hypothetical protein